MSARKVFSFIGLVLSLLLIVCLFLPFYDGYSTFSLWEYLDESKAIGTAVIIIIELLVAVVAFILQLTGACKDSKLAYLGLGYIFTYHLSLFFSAISNEAFNQLAWGYWMGLIISTIAVIITIIGNCVSNKKRTGYAGHAQPIGFDPKTGKPIYEEKKITGYDPHTGEPIYK